MNPDIFLGDFERTDHTDALHAMLGRALIMATRFDSLCKAAAIQLELKTEASKSGDEDDRTSLLCAIAEKYRTLNSSIKALQLPKEASVLLFDANSARNAVAHDLAKGLTGCLDIKVDEAYLIREISELMFDLAYGDIVISKTISLLNGDPWPRADVISSYVERVIHWVVEK